MWVFGMVLVIYMGLVGGVVGVGYKSIVVKGF